MVLLFLEFINGPSLRQRPIGNVLPTAEQFGPVRAEDLDLPTLPQRLREDAIANGRVLYRLASLVRGRAFRRTDADRLMTAASWQVVSRHAQPAAR